MANTTFSNEVTASVDQVLNRELLERAMPQMIYRQFSKEALLPSGAGTKTLTFRRYTNLSAATTALTEGTTPSGKTLAITDVDVTLGQYGDFVTLTDQVVGLTNEDIWNETGDLLAQQVAETLDQITRDVLAAGTTINYGGAAASLASVASGDTITSAEIAAMVLTAKGNNAKKLTPQVAGTAQVGTVGLLPSFVLLVHQSQADKIRAFTTFKEINTYPAGAVLLPGEIGSLPDVRVCETTAGKVLTGSGAAAIDVYVSVLLGANAFATVDISGAQAKGGPLSDLRLQFLVKGLGSAGADDPLDQRASAGWKTMYAAGIVNQAWLVVGKHALN